MGISAGIGADRDDEFHPARPRRAATTRFACRVQRHLADVEAAMLVLHRSPDKTAAMEHAEEAFRGLKHLAEIEEAGDLVVLAHLAEALLLRLRRAGATARAADLSALGSARRMAERYLGPGPLPPPAELDPVLADLGTAAQFHCRSGENPVWDPPVQTTIPVSTHRIDELASEIRQQCQSMQRQASVSAGPDGMEGGVARSFQGIATALERIATSLEELGLHRR